MNKRPVLRRGDSFNISHVEISEIAPRLGRFDMAVIAWNDVIRDGALCKDETYAVFPATLRIELVVPLGEIIELVALLWGAANSKLPARRLAAALEGILGDCGGDWRSGAPWPGVWTPGEVRLTVVVEAEPKLTLVGELVRHVPVVNGPETLTLPLGRSADDVVLVVGAAIDRD